MAWLQSHVESAGELSGVAVYRWGEVLAALSRDERWEAGEGAGQQSESPEPAPEWISTAEAATRLGIARSTLAEMVARAPRALPGAPLPVGVGTQRRHLHWDAGKLGEWIAAYKEWTAASSSCKAPFSPSRRSWQSPRPSRKRPKTSSRTRPSLLSVVAGNETTSDRAFS